MSDNNLFTEREKEVTEFLLQGKSNKQIAQALGVSASTVEYHLNNIYKKLQVNSRTEAVLRLGESTGSQISGELGKSSVELNHETTDNGVQSISKQRNPLNKTVVIIGGLLVVALVVILLLALVLANLSALSPKNVPTNASLLPDLTITSANVSMVDTNAMCLSYYGFNVTVVNQGDAIAHDVMLADNTGLEVGVGDLSPLQSKSMSFVAKAKNGAYTVTADPQNKILESDETNNITTFSGATATPYAPCLTLIPDDSKPTPVSTLIPIQILSTNTPMPMSARIVYYYFVPTAENPRPEGSVVILPDTYILAPTLSDIAYSPDTAANLKSALEAVLKDGRNGWVSSNLKIINVAFGDGRADVVLQGEYFGVGDVTLIAARMQILMTVFANTSVQTATVILNGDSIGNLGVSNNMEVKPADYVFTRSEIVSFINEHAKKSH